MQGKGRRRGEGYEESLVWSPECHLFLSSLFCFFPFSFLRERKVALTCSAGVSFAKSRHTHPVIFSTFSSPPLALILHP